MEAANRLRMWRGKRSCVLAARDLNCDPSYLSLLERGKRKPRDHWRGVIEKVVGIPAHLWDETGAHQATLDRVSPNVNDSRPKRSSSLTAPPKPVPKAREKARAREIGRRTPPNARKGAA